MTREEREKAINALKISAPLIAVTQEEFNDYIQTLNKIMNWLEQEPCTDAISRQAMHIELEKWITYGEYKYSNATKYLYDRIDRLPSVTPAEKMGHYDEFGFIDPFSFGKENEMTLFKIIDRETGKEPTDKVITAEAKLGNLITCDIDGFYVGEDGQIILVDDCGNCTWVDMGRFKVELQTEASPTGAEGRNEREKI